jgi:hypothetical protein
MSFFQSVKKKERTSFCEQKEAKKLYSFRPRAVKRSRIKINKVFLAVLLEKKNCFLRTALPQRF